MRPNDTLCLILQLQGHFGCNDIKVAAGGIGDFATNNVNGSELQL
jgi:hypothetical protein